MNDDWTEVMLEFKIIGLHAEIADHIKWCQQHIGTRDVVWSHNFKTGIWRIFYFKYPQDALMFKLSVR